MNIRTFFLISSNLFALTLLGLNPGVGQEFDTGIPIASGFDQPVESNIAPPRTGSTEATAGEPIDIRAEFERLNRRIEELESQLQAQQARPADGGNGPATSASKVSGSGVPPVIHFGSPRTDGDDDLERRVAALEKGSDKTASTLSGVVDDFKGVLHHSHKNPKMTFFGRIHLDYWAFPDVPSSIFPLEGGNPQDRFNFRRLRIGIKGDLNDNMFYKYEGEFAGGEATSYRDAFIGFRDLPYLNKLIIGNHKRPYGWDHLNSSRYNVFIERPFIVEAFNQDSRRLGISSNGHSQDLKYNWRYGVFNQQLTQTGFGYVGDHYQLEMAGRLAAMPWYDETSGGRGYAHVAIAGSVGYPDGLDPVNNQARFRTRPEARSDSRWLDTGRIAGADTTMLLALEGVVNVGPVQLVGEYMINNVDRLDAFGEDLSFQGGYVYVSYFLTGEHMPWDRKTGTLGRIKPFQNFFSIRDCDYRVQRGWGAWQVAARYSYADFNDQEIVGGQASSWTLGLNWYWNPYARMQLNWIMGDIDRNPTGSGTYDIIGLRMMVDF